MAVTVILAGLLFPTIAGIRENAYRVISSSNLRQMGLGLHMYVQDSSEQLPYTAWLDDDGLGWQPQELMAARIDDTYGWDGLGRLFHYGYVAHPSVFYSPAHTGKHPELRYESMWLDPGAERIYTNYHYAGDVDWREGELRAMDAHENFALITDGMRTLSDLNHDNGIHVLARDGSVTFQNDLIQAITEIVPREPASLDFDSYIELWQIVSEGSPSQTAW